MNEETSHIRLNLASGNCVLATVEDSDVDAGDSVEDYLAKALDGKPHWQWIGDARVYTQTVECGQVLDD